MKKLLIISLSLIATVAFAQKSQYISVKGQYGLSTLMYDLEQGTRTSGLAPGAELGYRFFFNENLGFGTGVGYNMSTTTGTFGTYVIDNGNYMDFDIPSNPVDPSIIGNGDPFTSFLELHDWKETQRVSYLNVPLVLCFQTEVAASGLKFYADLGARFFLPISASYEVSEGDFENIGFYAVYDDLLLRGITGRFDRINNYQPSGDMELTYGIAATASFGLSYPLADKIDLFAGVSVDYGLTDMKNASSPVVTFEDDVKMLAYQGIGSVPDPAYVGMANSPATSAVTPFSLGLEIGVRFCIMREEVFISPVEPQPFIDTVEQVVTDTVVVKDTIVTQEVEDAMSRMRQESEGLEVLNDDDHGNETYGLSPKEFEVLQFTLEDYPMSQTSLTDDQLLLIARKSIILNKHKHIYIKIIGHTCNTGSSEVNMKIGLERAMKTKQALEFTGVDPERITVASYGEVKPRYPNTTEKAKALNRRVTIEILPISAK